MIHKNLHDINTTYSSDNETTLIGIDETGEEFTITISTLELLEWIDKKHLKESLIKHIKTL